MPASLLDWLDNVPLPVLGALLLICMTIVASGGFIARKWADHREGGSIDTESSEGQLGYVVSAILGLLALLLGFTLFLVVDRFDARRHLVLDHANAIGTAYLRTQLLGEPHRARLSNLLVQYTDNVVVLAKGGPKKAPPLLAIDDRLLTDIWAATAASFVSIRDLDFSSTLVEAMNNLIKLDSARRAARQAHVPTEVFAVLLIYLVVTAGVLGYVLTARRGWMAAVFLMGLITLLLLLIFDIDRPTSGSITESQLPIEQLRDSLKRQPISVYDRWREPRAHR